MHTTAVPASPALGTTTSPRDLGGLLGLTDRGELPFPLTSVRVRSTIVGRFARTVVEQAFHNPHRHGLEAVHIFPLPPDGAVVEMELRSGDTVVRGECRARPDAEQLFNAARDSGHQAGLLTGERRDVHTLRVTNIAPGQDVQVRLVILERLDEADGSVEWRFPTVVAPRYMPGRETGHAGDGVAADTTRVPDASRISPPIRLAGGTTLDLDVAIVGPVSGVASSLHAVRATFGETMHVAPATHATLDRDFVLRIEPAPAAAGDAPVAAYTDGAHTAVVLRAPAVAEERRLSRDAVFVLDVSGSMTGAKMDAGRRALKAALRGLDAGDRFRLTAFNTSHQSFASDFVAFDDVTLVAADEWIDSLEAGGGTDVLRPLLDALAGGTPAGRLRTVLIITDGEVGNDDELAKTVARHRGRTLVFTVGIDTAVNGALLQRLARLGGGTCELMTPTDDIEGRIAALEARLAEPAAWDVRVEGGEAARTEAITLFAGRETWCLLSGAPPRVDVVGQTAAGAWHAAATPVRIETPLAALWARERVAWLEDQALVDPARASSLQDQATAVAIAHGIVTRHTAFVAVDTRVGLSGRVITVVQPVELPALWSAQAVASMPAPPMAAMPSAAAPRGEKRFAFLQAPPASRGTSRHAAPPRMARASEPLDLPSFHADEMAMESTPAGSGASDDRRRVESALALAQGADGSVEGDVRRTAALVLVLLALGHTRRKGSRRRVVQKAAAWLEAHRNAAGANDALDALARVEGGGAPPDLPAIEPHRRAVAALLGGDGWAALESALR